MKVVVTGACGFIGTALTGKLRNVDGIDVTGVARRNCQSIDLVIADYAESPEADVLVHLAENSDRSQVNADDERAFSGSTGLFSELVKKKYKKIIYASSSVLYGDAAKKPYNESDQIIINDAYTRIKSYNEKLAIDAGGIVLRLSNVIGCGMSSNNVLSDIIKQLPGEQPVILREASPIRDFIWIDDVVDAIVRLLDLPVSGAINLGSGIGISIEKLASRVLDLSGMRDKPLCFSRPSRRWSYNVLDISYLKNIAAWSPGVTIDESVERLIANNYKMNFYD